jgi:hypothetical protein
MTDYSLSLIINILGSKKPAAYLEDFMPVVSALKISLV